VALIARLRAHRFGVITLLLVDPGAYRSQVLPLSATALLDSIRTHTHTETPLLRILINVIFGN
jgi:hypothetical protein